jgi:hypothetical protein
MSVCGTDQPNAIASKPEQSNTKLNPVTARNPLATKSCLRMVHLPNQNTSLLATPRQQNDLAPRTVKKDFSAFRNWNPTDDLEQHQAVSGWGKVRAKVPSNADVRALRSSLRLDDFGFNLLRDVVGSLRAR